MCVCDVLKTDQDKGSRLLLRDISCFVENLQCHPSVIYHRCPSAQAVNVNKTKQAASCIHTEPCEPLYLPAPGSVRSSPAVRCSYKFSVFVLRVTGQSYSYAHFHPSSMLLILQAPLICIVFFSLNNLANVFSTSPTPR